MSLETLPDDLLLHLFSHYLADSDLGRLEQVCSRFHHLLHQYSIPWKRHLSRQTNVAFPSLTNAVGCPTFENLRHSRSIVSPDVELPSTYQYRILLENASAPLPIESNERLDPCENVDCAAQRLAENYRELSILNRRWRRKKSFVQSKIVQFTVHAQTSLLQYDEHRHQLWFTSTRILSCLDLSTGRIEHQYQFDNDDVLASKVVDDQLICLANGNQLRVISRPTNDVVQCDFGEYRTSSPTQRDDILALDALSIDRQNYLIVSGSRDHSLTVRRFDLPAQHDALLWRTELDDRVLATRLTTDGRFLLVGTGGVASEHPLVLFDTSRARPLHVYKANYRLGAGVRCLEWVNSNVFIAAGFDNQFKEFDLRTGRCHYTFEDDLGNDYSSMCVSNDRHDVANALILGANHHSTVRLVNRKQRRTENLFFVSDERSPVHSLAATPEYLFASVDRSIVVLDFTGKNRPMPNLRRHF